MSNYLWLMLTFISLITAKMIINFKNKLMILILMEMMFVMTITSQLSGKNGMTFTVTMLYLTIFMVLDSTMGITILMSSSRNSYKTMKQFSSI